MLKLDTHSVKASSGPESRPEYSAPEHVSGTGRTNPPGKTAAS